MSDANRVALRKLEEVTWNTTPASAMTNVRMTSESLEFDISNTQSQELQSDREVRDLIQTDATSRGDVAVEFSYGAHDDWLESAFQNTFSTAFSDTGTDTSADTTDDSFNNVSADWPLTLSNGQWIYVSGFTEAANNGWHQVSGTPTASKIIVTSNLTTEAAGDSVTIKSSRLIPGTTRKSFSIEKEFSDKTQFLLFRGMEVSQVQVAVGAGEIMTGTFSFLGGSTARAGTTFGTGGPTAAGTNDVLNGVNDIADIFEGGAALGAGIYITRLAFTINNNSRGLPAIGTLGSVDLGHGEFNVTGEATMYFEDGTIYDKFIAGTESDLSFSAADAAGNRYHINFPRIKYATAPVVTPGGNQDVFINLTFQALRDQTYGTTMQIARSPA